MLSHCHSTNTRLWIRLDGVLHPAALCSTRCREGGGYYTETVCIARGVVWLTAQVAVSAQSAHSAVLWSVSVLRRE